MIYGRCVKLMVAAGFALGATSFAPLELTASAALGAPATSKPGDAPSSLVILFDPGSSELRARDKTVLDHASRAYNQGKPIVMIITGSSDRTGAPQANLSLSERRATAVLRGLLDRGIPADRFQVLAKGETELPVPTPKGVAESQNRRVVISWH